MNVYGLGDVSTEEDAAAAFAQKMQALKYLAFGVAALFLLLALGSRR